MKIYTKQGDNGTTGLFSGQLVSKAAVRMFAIGGLDELQAELGRLHEKLAHEYEEMNTAMLMLMPIAVMFTACMAIDSPVIWASLMLYSFIWMTMHSRFLVFRIAAYNMYDLEEQVTEIITDLYNIMGNVATVSDERKENITKFDESRINFLENKIDAMTDSMSELTHFIKFMNSAPAAMSHSCRARCRSAERQIVYLDDIESVDENVLKYVNRLSDYLFTLSRYLDFMYGYDEVINTKADMNRVYESDNDTDYDSDFDSDFDSDSDSYMNSYDYECESSEDSE